MLTKVSTQVSKLRKENKVMRQLIKRRKSRTHSKQSAFHSVICCSKKAHLSHRGCQTDPMVQTTDVPPNKTVQFINFLQIHKKIFFLYSPLPPITGTDTYGGRPDSMQLPCRQSICSSALRPKYKQLRSVTHPCTTPTHIPRPQHP